MRLSLRGRLLLTYLVPTTLALAAVAGVSWVIARASLEASLGGRLESVAEAAAAELPPESLTFLRPGDEGTRTYARLRRQLESLRKATGVRRLFVFDPSGRAIVATGEGWPIGTRIPDLARDQLEVKRTLTGTATPSSVLFRGTDGRLYKTGYAPVMGDGGKVVAAVAADGSAAFFDVLLRLRREVVAVSVLGLLVIVVVSVVFSRTLTRPLRRLVGASHRIGEGDLETAVPVPARLDEVGVLAQSLERMRAELAARDRQLQMMLAGIAHEVRNPLGGIELFSGLLAEELTGDAEKTAHVGRIRTELAHLTRLVEEFLDYARERPLERSPVAARKMLVEVADLVAPEAEAKGVTVAVAGEGSGPTLDADESLLRRAVLNLMRNAVQATPGGGTVTGAVETRSAPRRTDGATSEPAPGDAVVLSICDTGPGVPEEKRATIFEPFFTTRERGSGLGLALVRKCVEAHGGTVRVTEAEGGGARFEITLAARGAPVGRTGGGAQPPVVSDPPRGKAQ